MAAWHESQDRPISRRAAAFILTGLVVILAVAIALTRPGGGPAIAHAASTAAAHPAGEDAAKLRAELARARHYARLYRAQRDWLQARVVVRIHELRGLRRTLLQRPSSLEALRLAAIAYHVDFGLLYRRASCESTGSQPASPPSERTLYPLAHNKSGASGLLQFLPSTWATTPYAHESIWSPYANAFAGGWMMGPAGRGGEWVCR